MTSEADPRPSSGITGVVELLDPKEVAALHRATLDLLLARDEDELARVLVDDAVKFLKGSFGYLMLHDGERLRLAHAKGLVTPGDGDATAEGVFARDVGDLISSGAPLRSSLAGESPSPQSLVYSPLRAGERCLGVLCVGAYRRDYGARELRVLGLLGSPAGHVVDSLRNYAATSSLSRKLGLVLDLQQLLARGPLTDTYRRFAAALHDVMPFDLALLLVHEPGAGELTIAQAWGRAGGAAWPGRRLRADASLHAKGLGRRKAHAVPELPSPPSHEDERWLAEAGVSSGLVLPLVSFDAVVGVFSLWSELPEAFGHEQLELVEGLGQPLALAVENSRLFGRVEQAKTEWESTFDAMNDAVCLVDAAGHIQRFNNAFRVSVGLDNDALLGSSLEEVLGVERGVLAFADGDESAEGRLFRELRGTSLGALVEVVGTRLRGPGWADVGTVFVARDVTATKELSARLQEADRLASIGHLAAAVAHEINNPLAYVLTNLRRVSDHTGAIFRVLEAARSGTFGESCKEAVSSSAVDAAAEELPALTGETLEGVTRLQQIVQKLQLYSSGEEAGDRSVSLNELLDFSLTLVWARLAPRAQVVYGYGDMPPLRTSIGQLTQVLVNVLVTAAESLDPAGAAHNVLEVSTVFGEGTFLISIQARGAPARKGRNVRKTHPLVDEGSLALAASIDIVRELGGEMEVIADPEGVKSFELSLPGPMPSRPTQQPGQSQSIVAPRRRGRVLVVDDELYVRRALSRILRGSHDVELAADASAALASVDGGASFDVILCDVVMPGMSGIAFHEELLERRPDLADAVVFVTGGVFTPEAEEAMRAGPNPIMRKPVEPADLLDMVASVMARRGESRR